MFEGRAATLLAFAVGLVIATAGTATAAKLITGAQIKDRSIGERDLAAAVVKKLDRKPGTGPAGPSGPAGERGATGATGEKGATGERGAAGDAALSYTALGTFDFVAPTTMGNVLAITLPAGTYVLHGQVIMETTSTTTAYAGQCFLGPVLAPIGLAQARLQGTATAQDKTTMPVTDVVSLSAEETLTMRCSLSPETAVSNGVAMGTATGRLVALKVSANVAQ